MKLRTTLLLAAIGGGLFAYIWFVDRHQSSTTEETQTSAKVLKLERDKITSLSVRNAGMPLELRKKDGVWTMEQPFEDRGESAAIEQLLSLVDGLKHESKIDLTPGKEADQLKEFGVAESELSIKLKTDSGKETELLVGKDSAVEGKIYVRQQGQNRVYVVRNNLRTQLTKKTDDFRDHRLSATPAQSVQKFAVKTAEGEIELERKNQHWNILKPLRARAADAKINDLLAGLLTANVSQFFPEAPSPEQNLTEPRATVTLQVEGSKDPVVLQVGATPAGEENQEKTFAKISTRKAVTVVPNKPLDALLKARPNDLRDRKLVRFESDIVDRITIEPAGKPTLVLARKGEAWVRKDGEKETPVKDGLAAKLLADLQTAEAVNFVADLATNLGQYGLASPSLKIRLSSYASENTAETKAGEKAILTLLFGNIEGESGYAKLEDEPYVVAAAKSLFESLPTDVLALLPVPAPENLLELNADSISTLAILPKDAPPSLLEKKDAVWKLAHAAPGNLDLETLKKIESLLGLLQGGRITDTSAETILAENIKTPVLTVKVSHTKDAKEENLILTLGLPTKTGDYPATLSGKQGIFLLSAATAEPLFAKILR